MVPPGRGRPPLAARRPPPRWRERDPEAAAAAQPVPSAVGLVLGSWEAPTTARGTAPLAPPASPPTPAGAGREAPGREAEFRPQEPVWGGGRRFVPSLPLPSVAVPSHLRPTGRGSNQRAAGQGPVLSGLYLPLCKSSDMALGPPESLPTGHGRRRMEAWTCRAGTPATALQPEHWPRTTGPAPPGSGNGLTSPPARKSEEGSYSSCLPFLPDSEQTYF